MSKFNFLKPLAMMPVAFVLSFATPSYGENMPRARIPDGAALADPNALIRMFAGRTVDWGGGSAAYWAPDGTFRAVNAGEQSLGTGRWYVTTASRMCYDGTWSWRQDFAVQSRDVSVCTRFMIDAQGQVWSTTEGMGGPWFPFYDDNINTGDAVSRTYNAMVTTLGVQPDATDG